MVALLLTGHPSIQVDGHSSLQQIVLHQRRVIVVEIEVSLQVQDAQLVQQIVSSAVVYHRGVNCCKNSPDVEIVVNLDQKNGISAPLLDAVHVTVRSRALKAKQVDPTHVIRGKVLVHIKQTTVLTTCQAKDRGAAPVPLLKLQGGQRAVVLVRHRFIHILGGNGKDEVDEPVGACNPVPTYFFRSALTDVSYSS